MKLCKDCRYYRFIERKHEYGRWWEPAHLCISPFNQTDPVTGLGEAEGEGDGWVEPCRHIRYGPCGLEAKWFEPKEDEK